MDFSVQMGMSITRIYFKEFAIIMHFCPWGLFLLNSVDPDEMQHHAYYLGLHCLRKYLFRGFWSSNGWPNKWNICFHGHHNGCLDIIWKKSEHTGTIHIYLYPRYEAYRGYIVFTSSVIVSVCLFVCLFVCKLFLSKISQQLLDLVFWNLVQSLIVMSCIV